ncbi:type I restriction-modification enzyme R subunit C-terminal domain-containing protein [Rhabdothermincola salaria]|uniref:type I restriction endonuclease subunit R n=1 Tax=Rhabdothermincola salaria TaxID=2903142 RepID=UPI001E2BF8EC|nr:type I restriction-modification enzyme R subunit C-terminal domain-containing protein [Rhabdothermincola salaria]MCD9625627.1 DEAD/DEAH box helicase family protein [Rhabdothermincola salaria]
MTQADSSYVPPEQRARQRIDAMLEAAGWVVQDYKAINLYGGIGVAVRELVTTAGPADYVLFVNRQAVGVIEAKKQGTTLSGVEWQTVKYQTNVPDALPSFLIDGRLPYGYESTGEETWFTCRLDPEPTSRRVFWFHRPETLEWEIEGQVDHGGGTLRARIPAMPELVHDPARLRDAQFEAITNVEASLKGNRSRALIQMATGSGKTFAAANICERLISNAQAKRILFLVDRGNLGEQTLKEFQGFEVPGSGHKFTELYNVQHLTHNKVDSVASVSIGTIQRVYSMLRGDVELADDIDELSTFDTSPTRPVEVDYQPALPIEAFDVIIVDECHRSIYGVWRQVLEYFDAFLIGLTATPGKQTFGFFNKNLVMEYGFPQAVADGVNVDFDVFRLSTAISEQGSTIEGGQGYVTTFRDRETRTERLEEVDEDLTYDEKALDKKVVAKDQIRTVVRAIRDNLPAMFPDRELDEHGRLRHIPKTLIFAKDDSHAEDIVRIAREELGKGNEVIAKITYKTSDGSTPKEVLQAFRGSYFPRIAVTVDMIATGTDVKPIEMVVFMRMVRSRNFFEQMKGRGVRTIDDHDLIQVTPDAHHKDRFVLVDAVGVTETKLIESTPLERKRGVSLEKLLHQVSLGQISEDLVSSLASRLARIDVRISPADRDKIEAVAGHSMKSIEHGLIRAIDPDEQLAAARAAAGTSEPTDAELEKAKRVLFDEAVMPLAANPDLRVELVNVQRSFDQVIDEISIDTVTRAEFSVDARARAEATIDSFKAFLDEHKDEITALQVLYSRPYVKRLTYADVKELADAISRPPHRWTAERLWEAYETLDAAKVHGAAGTLLTNIVSLVRYTLGVDDELAPFPQQVEERFEAWLTQQQNAGRTFTDEQLAWLRLIRDHLAASLSIEPRELLDPPFSQHGGLGRARELFGHDLDDLLADLAETVAA